MGLREVFAGVGFAAATLGVGAFLVLTVAGCGTDQTAAAAPAGTVTSAASQAGQTASQPQLPGLDQKATKEFQTATFAFG